MPVEAALRKRENEIHEGLQEKERDNIKLIRAEKALEEERLAHERDLERQMSLADGGAKRVQEA